MDVPCTYYETSNMKRKLVPDWHKQPGCQHQPIFNIPLDNVIIDGLHLMLRVMDYLETGLIFEVVDRDEAENKGKPPSARTSTHLDAPLTTVSSLGISLNVWRPKDSVKKLEWTSLLGREKRLLLRKLPCHFTTLLPPERAPVIKKLWAVSKILLIMHVMLN